jgi:antitoxin (DNA-binding transcriptional repressor) of toxin-antitoxin stability system
MKRMRTTDFRVHCLKVLGEVHATSEPVIVTKRGKAIVKIVRVAPKADNIFGFMKDKVKL